MRIKANLSAVGAGLLLVAGIGFAAAQDVIIAPEQETVIKEYVTKQKVQSIEAPADVQITVNLKSSA